MPSPVRGGHGESGSVDPSGAPGVGADPARVGQVDQQGGNVSVVVRRRRRRDSIHLAPWDGDRPPERPPYRERQAGSVCPEDRSPADKPDGHPYDQQHTHDQEYRRPPHIPRFDPWKVVLVRVDQTEHRAGGRPPEQQTAAVKDQERSDQPEGPPPAQPPPYDQNGVPGRLGLERGRKRLGNGHPARLPAPGVQMDERPSGRPRRLGAEPRFGDLPNPRGS